MDDACKKIIDDGFQFVKGKSSSKKEAANESEHMPKRRKLNQTIREKWMKELEEDINDLNDRIEYKNKRITAHLNIQDYKKCDELEEVTALKHQRRQLEAEKRSISTSMRKSKSYYRKKRSDVSKGTSPLSGSESEGRNTRQSSFPVSSPSVRSSRQSCSSVSRSSSPPFKSPSRSSPPFLSPDSCPPPDAHENSTVSDSCPPPDVHENSTVSHSSPPLNADNPPNSTCENLSMTLFSDPETVHSSEDEQIF